MTDINRRIGWGAAVLGLLLTVSAVAQENLDSGKTPAQLYASDCAICHKTPQGLSKGFGPLRLQPFLREHYTASSEAAGAIAAYVETMDRGAPPAERGPKRAAKSKEAGKAGDARSGKPKNDSKGEAKVEAKGSAPDAPAEAKPAESKPAEPAQAKTEMAKPADKPSVDAKPDDAKADSKKPDGEKKSD
jgi:hypothetical protein